MEAIVIRDLNSHHEVHRIDITGLSAHEVERVERGLGINFDFDQFSWEIEADRD